MHMEKRFAVARLKLGDKTAHGADLASASQMGFEQSLLLRAYGRCMRSTHYTEHRSWQIFCDDFAPAVVPEGDFAIARLYQLEEEKTKNSASSHQPVTPIARRIRPRQIEKSCPWGIPETRFREYLELLTLQPVDPNIYYSKTVSEALTKLEEWYINRIRTEHTTTFYLDKNWLANVLYPPSRDEQVVNSALVVFLNALTMRFNFLPSWAMPRIALIAQFQEQDDSRGRPSVLIEVKPASRSTDQTAIQIQQSAQMVARIKSNGDLAKSRKLRFHVSQDRHQIYVSVAEYDDDHLAYLNNAVSAQDEQADQEECTGDKPGEKRSEEPSEKPGEKPAKPPLSFLTMHQFGPFDTQIASHMRQIGPVLLAITLRAEAER
ncbi:hypothetical protein BDV26DRAFT_286178 [Aspergillus bertholletiae]|uniref:Uncharacterized protein n=1 Tax=Aspergillus bertholletiae TaxID=1226010 RepID=A0A5N7ASZ4_9EURO|nr:hypothetical protein BDV26DRAFT_286178 [Aspergillus bertholletiae]